MSISSEKLRKVLHPIQIDTMHFRFKPRRNPGSQSQHRSVNRTAVVSDEESYQKNLKVTREYLKPYMEVLEFGCGTGSTAIAHAAQVKHIQAIDISSRMIEIAQRKADENDVKNH